MTQLFLTPDVFNQYFVLPVQTEQQNDVPACFAPERTSWRQKLVENSCVLTSWTPRGFKIHCGVCEAEQHAPEKLRLCGCVYFHVCV